MIPESERFYLGLPDRQANTLNLRLLQQTDQNNSGRYGQCFNNLSEHFFHYITL